MQLLPLEGVNDSVLVGAAELFLTGFLSVA